MFIGLTIELHDLGGIRTIDAIGLDWIATSQHSANQTNFTFKAVMPTILVDCSIVQEIHCSMTQPHDSQVGWQLLKRKLDNLSMLTVDQGFDWWLLRNKLREEHVKPLIRAREIGWEGVAKNVLMGDRMDHQRSNIESVFALRQRFGGTLGMRTSVISANSIDTVEEVT